MRINTKRGHYMVETAVFLPVFIIAVMTIGCYINVVGADENVIHAAADEARYAAQEAYTDKEGGALASLTEGRILSEDPDIRDVNVRNMVYLYSADNITDLISFDIDYDVRIRLPLRIRDGNEHSTSIICRGFTGAGPQNRPMSFAAMEHEYDSRTVYVFPHEGKCYHKKSCTYVSSKPVQMTLNDHVRSKYRPCSLCCPGSLNNGCAVYCFTKYGDMYHRGNCSCIDKYYIQMERSEAEDKGYVPCSKCGGV